MFDKYDNGVVGGKMAEFIGIINDHYSDFEFANCKKILKEFGGVCQSDVVNINDMKLIRLRQDLKSK